MFYFDLTRDVMGDLEVNKVGFRSTNLTGQSRYVSILKKGPLVSEIGGGIDSSPVGRVIDKPVIEACTAPSTGPARVKVKVITLPEKVQAAYQSIRIIGLNTFGAFIALDCLYQSLLPKNCW